MNESERITQRIIEAQRAWADTERQSRPSLLALVALGTLVAIGLAGFGLAMGIVVARLMEVML